MNTEPTASRRPATTGSVAPGSHTHTNAVAGGCGVRTSEVVIDGFRRLTHTHWKQGKALTLTHDDRAQRARGDTEQLDTDKRRQLEHHPDGNRRSAAFSSAQRVQGHAGPFGELSHGPAALTAPCGDPHTQHSDPDQGCRRAGERD